MELKFSCSDEQHAQPSVLIVPFMELKLTTERIILPKVSLNRTFYGIEIFEAVGKAHSLRVLIVPFMELKSLNTFPSRKRTTVLIVPFMELKSNAL